MMTHRITAGFSRLLQVSVWIAGTPIRVVHVKALLLAQHLVPAIIRRAQARAIVGSGALIVVFLKVCLPQDAGVGDTVERTAAGHSQLIGFHKFFQLVHTVHRRFLEPYLYGTRYVLLALADWFGALAWGAKSFHDLIAVKPAHDEVVAVIHRAALATFVHSEITRLQPKPTLAVQQHEFAHQVGVLVFAVRRQAHHLVFFAEFVKTNVLAKCRVEETEAVRQMHTVEYFDARAFATRRHGAHKVAGGVIRETGREAFER